MKLILLPTDLKPESDSIWQYVLPIAQAAQADIHCVHAVDDIFVKEERDHEGEAGVDKITVDLIYKMRADADKGMLELVEKMQNTCKANGLSITITGQVENGIAEDVILQTAARMQPQLIAMGTHDHSRLDRLFFGSVTQSVLRKAHAAVLAVPYKYTFKPIQEVLYMSDLDQEDTYTAGKLINLFGAFPFNLHITHFNLDEQEKDAELYAIGDAVRSTYPQVPITFEVVDARILRDAYKQYISHKQIDLIALTSGKHQGISRFLHQSTAVDVLYHSKIPVLVFHKP